MWWVASLLPKTSAGQPDRGAAFGPDGSFALTPESFEAAVTAENRHLAALNSLPSASVSGRGTIRLRHSTPRESVDLAANPRMAARSARRTLYEHFALRRDSTSWRPMARRYVELAAKLASNLAAKPQIPLPSPPPIGGGLGGG